jgi:hypothetical protein
METHMEEDAVATADIRRDVQRRQVDHGRGPRERTASAPSARRGPHATTAGERQILSLLALSDGAVDDVAWCGDEASAAALVHVTMALSFAPNFIAGTVLQKNRRAAVFSYVRYAPCARRPRGSCDHGD